MKNSILLFDGAEFVCSLLKNKDGKCKNLTVVFRDGGGLDIKTREGIIETHTGNLNLEGAFYNENSDELYIDCKYLNMYQSDEVESVKNLIQNLSEQYLQILFVAVCMGAQGVIHTITEQIKNKSKILFISPIVKIKDDMELSKHTRLALNVGAITETEFDESVLAGIECYCIYDRRVKSDNIQVEQLLTLKNINFIPLFAFGHSNLWKLNQVMPVSTIASKILKKCFNYNQFQHDFNYTFGFLRPDGWGCYNHIIDFEELFNKKIKSSVFIDFITKKISLKNKNSVLELANQLNICKYYQIAASFLLHCLNLHVVSDENAEKKINLKFIDEIGELCISNNSIDIDDFISYFNSLSEQNINVDRICLSAIDILFLYKNKSYFSAYKTIVSSGLNTISGKFNILLNNLSQNTPDTIGKIEVDSEKLTFNKYIQDRIHVIYNSRLVFKDITINKFYIPLFFVRDLSRKDSSNTLYISMKSGSLDCDIHEQDFFSRWSWYNQLDGDLLSISDPMHKFIANNTCWFYGDKNTSLLHEIAIIINNIQNKFKYKNIIIFGLSSGAYASLYLSNHVKNSYCIAVNPQIKLDQYIASFVSRFTSQTEIDLSDQYDKFKRNDISYVKDKSSGGCVVFFASNSIEDVNQASILLGRKVENGAKECKIFSDNFSVYLFPNSYPRAHTWIFHVPEIMKIKDLLITKHNANNVHANRLFDYSIKLLLANNSNNTYISNREEKLKRCEYLVNKLSKSNVLIPLIFAKSNVYSIILRSKNIKLDIVSMDELRRIFAIKIYGLENYQLSSIIKKYNLSQNSMGHYELINKNYYTTVDVSISILLDINLC